MQNTYGKVVEKIFSDTMDVVLNGFFEGQDEFIFKNQNERFAVFFPLVAKQSQNWKKSRNCIYKGCNNKSINKSHALTKNLFLSFIAENGKVYAPRQDNKMGRPKIQLVGINEASTFPGFCPHHERLFFEFEKKRKLTLLLN